MYHHLYYEMKLASFREGVDLRIFKPDVDRDGFDLFLESEDWARKLQTKVVQRGAQTSSWSIHKRFLRPNLAFCEQHGLPPTVAGDGLGGAVLLIDAFCEGDRIQVGYRFFDITILTARRLGLIVTSVANSPKISESLDELSSESLSGGMYVRSWMFVHVKSTDALLALLGLRSSLNSSWFNTITNAGDCCRGSAWGDNCKAWLLAAREELDSLIHDDLILISEIESLDTSYK